MWDIPKQLFFKDDRMFQNIVGVLNWNINIFHLFFSPLIYFR